MPIEIKELIVKTTIEGNAGSPSAGSIDSMLNDLKEQIIEECIERLQGGNQNTNER